MKTRTSIIFSIFLLSFLTLGLASESSNKARENIIEEKVTVTETIYTYTGKPITETSTKTVREYVTVTQTITEHSIIFTTQTLTVFRTISYIVTEIATMTAYEYLPLEAYSVMLLLMTASLIILLVILTRIRRSESKQVRSQWN